LLDFYIARIRTLCTIYNNNNSIPPPRCDEDRKPTRCFDGTGRKPLIMYSYMEVARLKLD